MPLFLSLNMRLRSALTTTVLNHHKDVTRRNGNRIASSVCKRVTYLNALVEFITGPETDGNGVVATS